MITQPFPRLAAAMPGLQIVLLTKEDPERSDAEIGGLLHARGSVALRQVHGARTVSAREPMSRTEEADGALTDEKNLCLTVRAADCQMLVIAAPAHGVIGVLHAGWKGLIQGAIPSLFTTLREEWGINGDEAWIGLGPSLCAACAEFTDPHRELPGIDPAFIRGRHADLQGIADAQLRAAGVHPDRIDRHPDCTRCHPERYWTYRGGDRDAVQAGRTNVLAVMM